MPTNRPKVISIAGFDPSGGAGILADIKTFEQHQVYGFAIITAHTIQTENEFVAIEWTGLDFVLQSIQTLFDSYPIKVVKIGIVPSLEFLKSIVLAIKKESPTTKIVWDTVLKSTTEFDFLKLENQTSLIEILTQIDLITPNYNEIIKLGFPETNPESIAQNLQQYCAVLLKGGHNPTAIGVDYLFIQNQVFKLLPDQTIVYSKHGSGCVLSSSISANIAMGQELYHACKNAKKYTQKFLSSTKKKLGFHNV